MVLLKTAPLRLLFTILVPFACNLLRAQTIEDGVMIGRNNLFAGYMYSHDSWDHYWEGSLSRVNGNLGTVTTQTSSIFANYGVTNHLNLIGILPYIQTDASQGVLAGQHGYQDVTIAAKYSFIDRPLTHYGSIRFIGVVAASIPTTDYNPDFQPLSIGNHSKRIASRLTLNYQTRPGWFVNGTAAITWRSIVTLDRPYYYTMDYLYLTPDVDMPGVFDYTASAGYFKHGLMSNFSFSEQRTQGGGDIRRQDAPFISNKFNYTRVGAMIMAPIPFKRARNVALQLAWSRVIDGRNVGESSTWTTGLFYTLHFHRRSPHQ